VIWVYLKRIFALRENHKLTQKAVAEYLRIQPNVYRRYEKGVRDVPVEILIKLADFYRVSTDYLLDRVDDPTGTTV